MFYLILLGIFMLINLANMVFFYSKDRFRKLSIVFYGISLAFSIVTIIAINISYNGQILKEFSENDTRIGTYLEIIKQLNFDYIIISLITLASFCTIVFILRALKVKYIIIYDLIVGIQIIMHFYLFFFKCIIITKDNIDMSLLANSLMWYYLNFAALPLVIAKYMKSNKQSA